MSKRELAAGHTRLRVQDDWGPVDIIVKPDGGMFVESLVGRECFAQEPAAVPRVPKRWTPKYKVGDRMMWPRGHGPEAIGQVPETSNGYYYSTPSGFCAREASAYFVPEARVPKRGELWRVRNPIVYGTCDGILAGQWVRATGAHSDDCRRVVVGTADGRLLTVWLDNIEPVPPLPEE